MEHNEGNGRSQKTKHATLRDVAKLANVGAGSVSRYLNGDQSIKDINRQKISDAIQELNFVPNVTARKLAKGRSGNILLLMVSETPITMATWIYEKEIVQEIYSGLLNSEYSLQLALCSSNQNEIYKKIKSNIETKNADAVMILSNYRVEQNCVALLEDNSIPYVLIGCKNYKEKLNEILIDNYSAMKIVMDYLVSLRHRKIAFISGNQDQEQMAARIKCYFTLMQEKGFDVNPNYIAYGEYSMDSGYNCTKQLIQQNFNDLPTAIICSNDIIACGAIKALKEYNIKIPKEISITGFDNLTSAEVIEPPLTTFQLPAGMGTLATQMLLKMIKSGKTNIVNERQMKFEFIIRNSAALAREDH